MPRLQFSKFGWAEKPPPATTESSALVDDAQTKKELRPEIKYWWQAQAERLDKSGISFSQSYTFR
jgi:hypothetical protein